MQNDFTEIFLHHDGIVAVPIIPQITDQPVFHREIELIDGFHKHR